MERFYTRTSIKKGHFKKVAKQVFVQRKLQCKKISKLLMHLINAYRRQLPVAGLW